jgi:hypothetical protein
MSRFPGRFGDGFSTADVGTLAVLVLLECFVQIIGVVVAGKSRYELASRRPARDCPGLATSPCVRVSRGESPSLAANR